MVSADKGLAAPACDLGIVFPGSGREAGPVMVSRNAAESNCGFKNLHFRSQELKCPALNERLPRWFSDPEKRLDFSRLRQDPALSQLDAATPVIPFD